MYFSAFDTGNTIVSKQPYLLILNKFQKPWLVWCYLTLQIKLPFDGGLKYFFVNLILVIEVSFFSRKRTRFLFALLNCNMLQLISNSRNKTYNREMCMLITVFDCFQKLMIWILNKKVFQAYRVLALIAV